MEDNLTHAVIGLAIEVHSALGPGLLESTYLECLYFKLKKEGFYVEKEKPMPVYFEGVQLDCGYRIDLLVEDRLVLEIKSVKELANIHTAQILTYMKLGDYNLGLIMNFNSTRLKDGIRRLAN